MLLHVASVVTDYVGAFPPSPASTVSLLQKLDHCFASLLLGKDINTGEILPGFDNGLGAGMTTTDMVRCRSSVEQTRILLTELLSDALDQEDAGEDEDDNMDMGREGSFAGEDGGGKDTDEALRMGVAQIYENTIEELGKRLGDSFSPMRESSPS